MLSTLLFGAAATGPWETAAAAASETLPEGASSIAVLERVRWRNVSATSPKAAEIAAEQAAATAIDNASKHSNEHKQMYAILRRFCGSFARAQHAKNTAPSASLRIAAFASAVAKNVSRTAKNRGTSSSYANNVHSDCTVAVLRICSVFTVMLKMRVYVSFVEALCFTANSRENSRPAL